MAGKRRPANLREGVDVASFGRGLQRRVGTGEERLWVGFQATSVHGPLRRRTSGASVVDLGRVSDNQTL
jgi:hypothetical protein